MKKRNLFVSFSGGETSAYMARWLQLNKFHEYDEVLVLFSNTGQENEETLEFVRQCDEAWGLGVVWVEAVVHHGKRRACTHKVVDFHTASRAGEPFEEVIRKYGIPNKAYPHCTRELKLNPMRSYVKSLGWENYDTAVGIRLDEIDRMSAKAREEGIIYPLIKDAPTTKPEINAFWDRQPFRLRLAGYEGNCKWCWKKSLRKHLTLISQDPSRYDFPDRMERAHGLAGHNVDGTPRVFFREGKSTGDLRLLAAQGGFTPADDDSLVMPSEVKLQEAEKFGADLDEAGACSESCEIYADGV